MIHPMAATGESSARIASVYGSKLRFKLQLVSISLSKELALLVLVRGSWYFESLEGERGLVCPVPQRPPSSPMFSLPEDQMVGRSGGSGTFFYCCDNGILSDVHWSFSS